jgi:hypothetical protein
MCKSIVKPGSPQMKIWSMSVACWVPNATNTHTDCAMLVAFPLQQVLHESASMLRYTYIGCLVLSQMSSSSWRSQVERKKRQ